MRKIGRLQATFLLLLPAAVLWIRFGKPSYELAAQPPALISERPSASAPPQAQPLVPEATPPAQPLAPSLTEAERAMKARSQPLPGGRRLVFEVHSDVQEHDTWGVGLLVDPTLRQARDHMFVPDGRAELANMSRAQELLVTGLTSFKQVLNVSFAAALRRRLFGLELDLSHLPLHDMRWCHRYCKNMFIFAPALRAVAHTLGSVFLEQLGTQQLFLMNDEISYNVHGEHHFDGWHLDVNAWLSLPSDAWGWTIYVPLDEGSRDAGGGWLRFRDKQTNQEWDEEFRSGDVLIFDRWIWHRLHDFIRERPPRLAYLLRVTNDTRFVDLPLAPQFHEPLAKRLPFPVGWQINYYCTPFMDNACRPRMGGEYDPESEEVKVLRFEVDADGSLSRTQEYASVAGVEHASKALVRLTDSLHYMGRHMLFEKMPDGRCDREEPVTRLSVAGQDDTCSLWHRLRRESRIRTEKLTSAAACREVVLELPPVLPRCVRWRHCAKHDDLVSAQLIEHRETGGFPDCLLLLPVLSWHAYRRGNTTDSLDEALAFDVGANIGSCSLLLLAAGMRVVAFEPVADNRAHLLASVVQNPPSFLDRLALLPYGLASHSRTGFMVSQRGNAGNSHVQESKDADIQAFADDPGQVMLRSGEVTLRRLDDLTSLPTYCGRGTEGAVVVMKVDVQGFEFEVFSGAKDLLQGGAVGAVLFECEAQRLAQHSQDTTPLDVFELLRESGFSLVTDTGKLIAADDAAEFAQRCEGPGLNVLALHSVVYPEAVLGAISRCLQAFWLDRDHQDFRALSSGSHCSSFFAPSR